MSIFVIHGASSAGKTTIGRALQTTLGEHCVYVSIDALWPSLPADQAVGAKVFGDLTEVLFAQAAQWDRLGYDVVVDTVFESRECVSACARHSASHDTYLVAVACSNDTLERREAARGNRRVGMALDQALRVYAHTASDIAVDSGVLSPEACASLIVAATQVPPRALRQFLDETELRRSR